MDEKTIKDIVKETVAELRRKGMLKEPEKSAYAEMSERLRAYYKAPSGYRAMKLKNITLALEQIASDPYYDIIPMYFKQNFTLERIAEYLAVEVSTVTRNKKRLCLMLYELAQ